MPRRRLPRRPRRAPARPWWSLLLALALALAALPVVHAAPASGAKEPPLPEEAREYHKQAESSRAQGNHATAAQLFKAAYRELGPPGQPTQWPKSRGALTAEIYTELLAAYNEHRWIGHLCGLHEHLTAYREEALPAFQAQQVAEMLVELERTVAATTGRETTLEDACRSARPEAAPVVDRAQPMAVKPQPSTDADRQPPVVTPDKISNERRPRHRELTASGAVLLAIGLGGVAGMSVPLVLGKRLERADDALIQKLNAEMRDLTPSELADSQERSRQGIRYNKLAVATGVSGGVLVALGASLLIAGARLRPRKLSVRPSLSPTGGSLTVHLRF